MAAMRAQLVWLGEGAKRTEALVGVLALSPGGIEGTAGVHTVHAQGSLGTLLRRATASGELETSHLTLGPGTSVVGALCVALVVAG